MRFVAQDRIANITKMRYLGVIENNAVFEFAGIAKHDPVANDYIFADVTAGTDLAIASYPGWADDSGSILDDGSWTDGDPVADKWSANGRTLHCRLQRTL